jgi:hypothetical protein
MLEERKEDTVMPEPLPMTLETMKLSQPVEDAPIEVPPTAEEIGVLNDEVMIEIAPDRPCGTIRVRLAYAGPSTPLPADDPWAE